MVKIKIFRKAMCSHAIRLAFSGPKQSLHDLGVRFTDLASKHNLTIEQNMWACNSPYDREQAQKNPEHPLTVYFFLGGQSENLKTAIPEAEELISIYSIPHKILQ